MVAISPKSSARRVVPPVSDLRGQTNLVDEGPQRLRRFGARVVAIEGLMEAGNLRVQPGCRRRRRHGVNLLLPRFQFDEAIAGALRHHAAFDPIEYSGDPPLDRLPLAAACLVCSLPIRVQTVQLGVGRPA